MSFALIPGTTCGQSSRGEFVFLPVEAAAPAALLGRRVLRDARAVAVAGLALALRVPMLLAVTLAVAATALVRAVG